MSYASAESAREHPVMLVISDDSPLTMFQCKSSYGSVGVEAMVYLVCQR